VGKLRRAGPSITAAASHTALPAFAGSGRIAAAHTTSSLFQSEDESEQCHRLRASGGRVLGLIDGFEQLGFGLVQSPSGFIVADSVSLRIELLKADAVFEVACRIG